MRTQEEILLQIEVVKADPSDLFGVEVLVDALNFANAKPYLIETATESDWKWMQSDDAVRSAAKDYLEFAIGKILDHRGISASRSVDKLTQYAWLLGADETVSRMKVAGYANYGAPKVKAFAEGLGFMDIWNANSDQRLENMAEGKTCQGGYCIEGCGG